MTTPHPSTIATEILEGYDEELPAWVHNWAHAMIVRGIEADRAQRERFDKIAADRAEEAAISVNAVLMAEQDGFITLSDHDKTLLTRAREHMNVIAADLRDEDEA